MNSTATNAGECPETISKPYHHGDLRQQLICSACDHIAKQGTEKLSLRALAREAGVSATAPYRHFATKNCLLAAIATEGFAELLQRMNDDVGQHDDRMAQFAACGRAYVEYALENSIKFHLMFGGAIADFSNYEELQRTANAAFDVVIDLVEKTVADGYIEDAPVDEIAAYMWSSMHGIASLLISKRQRLEADIPPEHMPRTVQTLVYMRDHLETMLQRVIKGVLK